MIRGHDSKIGVVVVNRNYSDYVTRALESIRRQTVTNWDLVVVDDSSTDESVPVISEFRTAHPDLPMTVVLQPHGGLSRARNTGIRLCQSELILCLDSDDFLSEDALETMSGLLEGDPSAAVARHLVAFEFPDGRSEVTEEQLQRRAFSLETLSSCNVVPYCAMFRRCWWERVRGYDESLPGYEDWDFWLSVAEQGGRFVSSSAPLVHYRVSDTGLYAESRSNDDMLQARVVLNHPRLYGWKRVQAANELLAGLVGGSA